MNTPRPIDTDSIPPEILEKIQSLEVISGTFAAFDLDNTLLVDDVGEATFAILLKRGLISGYTWNDYINHIEKNRMEAYKRVISIMNGLPLTVVEEAVLDVLRLADTHIDTGSEKIPVPRPNIAMQAIIELLKQKGIIVYIVTATNEVSAKVACLEHFGLPPENIFGAVVEVDEHGIISFVDKEIPYGVGKVNVLKSRFTGHPVVTGGDGMWDRFLLDYTTPHGIRLWVGNSSDFDALKKDMFQNVDFFQVPRR